MNAPLLGSIAYWLAPLMDADYGTIFCVHFHGDENSLVAYATDRHVLARVTVLGDFSDVGHKVMPGHRVASLDFYLSRAEQQWAEPLTEQTEAELYDDAVRSMRAPTENELTREAMERVMPKSVGIGPVPGLFLGPVLRTAGEILDRCGMQVAVSGAPDGVSPIRLDSKPRALSSKFDVEPEVAWISIAVMPSGEPKPADKKAVRS